MRVMLHCTDKNVNVEGHILNYKSGLFLEVAVNTIKIKMTYRDRVKAYVGGMAGLEFTIKEDSIPKENFHKDYQR